MNQLQISLRHVRTRLVSNALTCLAVTLGVALFASLWPMIAVASIGVCVALYRTMHERRREIASTRSLGAWRAQIVTVILAEAAVVTVLGAVLGVILCHLGAFVAGDWIAERTGVGVDWATFAVRELWLILGVAVLGGLAGLLPAVKGSLTEVADNLGPVS